jgi:uncharacterized caspase-like protein
MRWLACFILSLSLALTAGMAKAEPRLALVIANGAYEDGLPPLANPVNDGKLVAATLKKLGFAVTLVENVDQKGMKRAIAQFGDALGAAGPTTSALFYYAGHGLQVDGQNYLVPIHAAIAKEADVDLEAVSADTVLKQMEYAAPSTSIVILDACRNNPLSRGMRDGTRGLARMDAPNGSYVAYSTAPGQTAADGNGKNSPFATALVAEMVKPGQGIEEAFRNVRVNVSKATHGEQTPWDSSSLMSSFYFAGEKQATVITPEPAPVVPQPVAATPAPAVPTLDAAEQAFWNSIKDSNRAGDYAAYLKKYPQGTFAELAQSRKEELAAQIASRNVTAPAAPAQPAAAPAAIEPEPDFESPLADGTIVLSAATAAELDAYLNAIANQGPKTWAYFYVAPNGKAAGSARCKGSGAGNAGGDWPTCPAIEDMQKKMRVKAAAQKQCEAKNQGDCVMLYYGEQKKAEYKALP